MELLFLRTKTSYSRDYVCQKMKAKTPLATATMVQQDPELRNNSKFTKVYDVVCLLNTLIFFILLCFMIGPPFSSG